MDLEFGVGEKRAVQEMFIDEGWETAEEEGSASGCE